MLAGPVTAEAVFLNHEELSVRVLYRDPVHDFAFVRCDLSALKVRVHSTALLPACHAACPSAVTDSRVVLALTEDATWR